jgi:quercetin dioxygenase-like cupin family protein
MADNVYPGWQYPSVKGDAPAERYIKMIIAPEVNGYEHATVLFSHIPPGGSTGRHTHTVDEIMHVTGRGEAVVGDKVTKLETDSVIFAPRNVEHECRNPGDTDTLKLFCVYVPALQPSPLVKDAIEKTKAYLKKDR